ncbi:bacterioferritin-associated ferredoxin [Chitinivorax sp. B]|uniref:bacterioferritin-associated ferredoxin n=1 Tax=Chitinivorax sp. B TaxID=2502235 RepID=UPI0010FA059F|nr:bacterioferritin-associated ferredoxin [Chitinivorax sp. B]
MYVCICHAVTDTHIRQAVEGGCCSMRDLRNELNVATQCGRCACHAREVLRESLHQIAEPMIASAA